MNMTKARDIFSEADQERIATAVTEAEKKTSAEIVPVVADSSGRYDRAEDFAAFLMTLILFCLVWVLFQDVSALDGDWESGYEMTLGLFSMVVTLIVGYLLGVGLATLFPILRLPFVSEEEMTEEVERAASEAFHNFRLRATADSTGLLIYVSLYERKVRVIGDDAVAEKLTRADWEEVRNLMIEGLRHERPTDGFCDAILKAGDILAPHFPRLEGDVDELPNELRIIE